MYLNYFRCLAEQRMVSKVNPFPQSWVAHDPPARRRSERPNPITLIFFESGFNLARSVEHTGQAFFTP